MTYGGDQLEFKVVKVADHNEVLARAGNLLIGRAAYETACSLYPDDLIQCRPRQPRHREK